MGTITIPRNWGTESSEDDQRLTDKAEEVIQKLDNEEIGPSNAVKEFFHEYHQICTTCPKKVSDSVHVFGESILRTYAQTYAGTQLYSYLDYLWENSR